MMRCPVIESNDILVSTHLGEAYQRTNSRGGKRTMKACFSVLLGLCVGHVIYSLCRRPYECTEFIKSLTEFNKSRARILCYINTHPPMYEKKAIHVQNTWARRCDKFLFTSTQLHPNLSVLLLNLSVPEVRSHLWVKMRVVLRKLYEMADEYDYFFKADDDTYAVVENLRVMLWDHSPKEAFLTGYRWDAQCPGGYFSGGSGYVYSRETLKRLVESAIDRLPNCPQTDEDKEDVKMSQCGRAVGVRMLNKIGETGRSLFFPYPPSHYFKNRKKVKSYSTMRFNPMYPYFRRPQLGFSERHISFHYIEPKFLYILEFLQYFMNPLAQIPDPISDSSLSS